MSHVAKLSISSRGLEQEIERRFEEEAPDDHGITLHFRGDQILLTSARDGTPTDWEPDSLRETFTTALHRVLPGCTVEWHNE